VLSDLSHYGPKGQIYCDARLPLQLFTIFCFADFSVFLQFR